MVFQFLIEQTVYIQAVSDDSETVGTGAKTFTLDTSPVPRFVITMPITARNRAGTKSMTGTVSGQNGADLAINVTSVTGTGNDNDWIIGGETILRYATGQAGFVTHAADTPAHTLYEAKVKDPGTHRRSMFAPGRTGGRSEVGFGEIVLINRSGDLDALRDYGLDGRATRILMVEEGAALSTAEVVVHATADLPAFSEDLGEVRIPLRDGSYILERVLQTAEYAGSNSLPNGLEGTAADLKGKKKPEVYGEVSNVSPPMANTARLIVQLGNGLINDAPACWDRAVGRPKGSDYANQAAMESTQPDVGYYRLLKASTGSYARLRPNGSQITFDIVEGANDAARTVGQIIKRIITGPGALTSGQYVNQDFTDLDTANTAKAGYWSGVDPVMIPDVLDELSQSVGAFWAFDLQGRFRIARFEAPGGSPAFALRVASRGTPLLADEFDILTREIVATDEDGGGLPFHRVRFGGRKNYTVQSSTAGAATDARRAFVSEEYRYTSANAIEVWDPDNETGKHPLSPELDVVSLLVSESDQQTEANRLRELYRVRRDLFRVKVKLVPDLAPLLEIGVVAELQFNRLGYENGRLMTLLGIEYQLAESSVWLELWG